MRKRMLAPDIQALAKALIGSMRRARGLSVAAVAAEVGISPHTLEEYERPGGPCPARPTFADLGVALSSPAMLTLMMPDGWLVLSPDQVELVRDALVAAGILPG
jgi:transcriptional regulator with XRE-family HTH domain